MHAGSSPKHDNGDKNISCKYDEYDYDCISESSNLHDIQERSIRNNKEIVNGRKPNKSKRDLFDGFKI